MNLLDYLGQEPSSAKKAVKLPVNPTTGKPYTRYLFIGADQRRVSQAGPNGYIPSSSLKAEKRLLEKLEQLAKSKGFKVVKNTRVDAMQMVWAEASVTHVIVHSHGTQKNAGIQCSYKKKGGIFDGKILPAYKPVEEIFDPTKGKGKSLAVACCYPYSNIIAKSNIYSQQGVKLENFYKDTITKEKDDRVTGRDKNRFRIIKYLESLKN